MASERTSIPTVFGVLSIIFGALGALVAGGLALASTFDRHGGSEATAISLGFFALSSWLIVIGIGQYCRRSWARVQARVWGVIALGALVAMLVATVAAGGPGLMFLPIETVAVFFLAPYPILSLVMFARADVKEAMLT